jgi:membrane-bound lytic murein transglycosylase B
MPPGAWPPLPWSVVRVVPILLASTLLAACASAADPDLAGEGPTTTPSSTTTSSTTTTAVPPTTTTTVAPDVFALEPPAPARTRAGLADQIAAAEAAIRDPATTELDLARAALAQQVAYRQLGTHPEWDEGVLAALPEDVRGTVTRHAAARRELRGMHTRLSDTLPAWRIVAPEPADELVAIYQEAGAAFDIPWTYLAAINLVETGIGRIRGTSTAGAQGPMQFLPATWAAYGAGGDIHDTRDAIFGAARYLAANNGATDISNALYRYNHSNRYVRGVTLYADLIAEHPRAFLGFYHWGIWYLTTQGDVYLPVGYDETAPIPVGAYRP